MLKHFIILAIGAAAACSQLDDARTSDEQEAAVTRYVITVLHDEGQDAAPADMKKVVTALEEQGAQSVEVLEGLPTIIVMASPGAIEAAQDTGLVSAVQADGLSAPQ